jgi:molybdopterin synthase catalytic subunit
MKGRVHIDIKEGALRIDPSFSFVSDAPQGAIASFVGVVRNHHEGKTVSGMTYDVHDIHARNTLKTICLEVENRWSDTNLYIEHAKGDLKIGDPSVVIAVSSPHRDDAFQACRYMIEEIKKRLPVWKKEHYIDHESGWLPGHSLMSKDRE